ncbi:MAG: winged helix-turn-helix domain-containing protein [Treponema sp.]|nr:winged helix-turn-helix domain-containing protein [Treponema sp.]
MTVLLYTEKEAIAKILKEDPRIKDLTIVHSTNLSDLMNEIRFLEEIDLFIKTSETFPTHGFNFYEKIIVQYCYTIPWLFLDLNNEFETSIIGMEKFLNSLPEEIDGFYHPYFFECFSEAIQRAPFYVEKDIMTPTTKMLYNYLLENKGKNVSLENCAKLIWGVSNEKHTKTLYSYIHELRKFLGNDPKNPCKLLRTGKGIYSLT